MKTSLKQNLEQVLHHNRWKDKKFLLAISGGRDSMVLLHLFQRLNVYFDVAHVNYGFRPEESKAEALLVKEHCKNKCFHLLQLEGYKSLEESNINNLQDFARKVRYQFFEKILKEKNLDFIVTAHHQQDNVETVLLHFFKGTGIKGLSGIKELNAQIWRPLLNVSQEQLQAYCEENKVSYLMDSSNLKNDYDRNFIRNQIIPLLEDRFPNFVNNIAQNIAHTHFFQNFYQQYIEARKKLVLKQQESTIFLDILRWNKEYNKEDILLDIIRAFDFAPSQLQPFLKLIDSQQGAELSNEKYKAIKENNKIYFESQSNAAQEIFCVAKTQVEAGIKLSVGTRKIELQLVSSHLEEAKANPQNQFLNLQKIEFPIIIRKIETGDYFYPLGLNKKKKISKFLIDEKTPIHLREKTFVLISQGKILAVLGHRIDHRFRIEQENVPALKISIS